MTMVISGSDGVTFPDSTTQNTTDRYGFVNRIINGDMRIDQRNAGAAVTTNTAYPVDRFTVTHSTDGAFSAQQDSSAPTGFVSSIKYTTTTADGTLTGTQRLGCVQRIEGTNIADLAWGTANAKTVTLSFWVRSSLTGTFGGTFKNSANDRSYPFTYTISAADTWEYKNVTVAGDTSGTWLTTTGVGIRLEFGLGCGPDGSGTAGAWAGANYFSATGAVSVIGTLNATWYITGVQLEVGSVATPFERRPFGAELALCQRYYQQVNTGGSGLGSGLYAPTVSGNAVFYVINFPVAFRAGPTVTTSNLNTNASLTVASVTGYTTSAFLATNNAPSTNGAGYLFFNYTASAEL